MKKVIYLVVAVLGLGLASCGNSGKKQAAETEAAAPVATVAVDKAVTVEDLLANAAAQVEKEVVVKGKITHTCKHSGRRCFIVGTDGETSIRIEAKGNIGGFNRELIGSQIAVKGILHETRLTKAEVEQMEKDLTEGKDASKSAEVCETEMNNIKVMQEWMKENNEDSYALYHVDGMEFEVIE